jgi:AraC-like DNA-binding protein
MLFDGPPRVASVGVGVHGVGVDHDRFCLPGLWQLHLYDYHAQYAVDGRLMQIAPGTVSCVPPGSVVDYWYRGRSEHLYAHFALAAPGPEGPLPQSPTPQALIPQALIPHLQDAGDVRFLLAQLLRRATAAHVQGSQAAAAHVWSALCLVEELARRTVPPRRHPALVAAIEHIEARLADPVTVAGLARECGVSHNHLTRLFAAQLGTTVVGYIRDRRMQRAHHLLTTSTLPVAAVAAAVGVPDLQAFNKVCRRCLGDSPRALRQAALDGGGRQPRPEAAER